MESGLEDRNNDSGLRDAAIATLVSMESGLEDRNNRAVLRGLAVLLPPSQWSPA